MRTNHWNCATQRRAIVRFSRGGGARFFLPAFGGMRRGKAHPVYWQLIDRRPVPSVVTVSGGDLRYQCGSRSAFSLRKYLRLLVLAARSKGLVVSGWWDFMGGIPKSRIAWYMGCCRRMTFSTGAGPVLHLSIRWHDWCPDD